MKTLKTVASKATETNTRAAAIAAAKKGKASVIYGGITILRPKRVEVNWDGESFEEGIKKLASMTGTKYRTDWTWGGDLDPSECDIYVRYNDKEYDNLHGPKAIENLMAIAKKNNLVEAAVKEEAAISTKRAGYMRDVADEEQNTNDIVGMMLRGSDLDMEVLITYNRQTNTFHQNYNSSIVSEMDIVTGVWKSFTPLGTIKVKNLRSFYELKMPEEVRRLSEKIRKGEAPTMLPDLNGPGVAENIPGRGGINPDTMLMYDLDNVHLSSASDAVIATRRKVVADVDLGSGDDFVSTHSYVEQALTQTGFNFVMQEKTRDYYRYLVTFKGRPLKGLDAGDTEDINDVSECIELAVGTLGWNIEAATFPVVNAGNEMVWLAAGAGCGIRVNSRESCIEFYRIAQ